MKLRFQDHCVLVHFQTDLFISSASVSLTVRADVLCSRRGEDVETQLRVCLGLGYYGYFFQSMGGAKKSEGVLYFFNRLHLPGGYGVSQVRPVPGGTNGEVEV